MTLRTSDRRRKHAISIQAQAKTEEAPRCLELAPGSTAGDPNTTMDAKRCMVGASGDFSDIAIWRLPMVMSVVGLAKSGIYRAIVRDGFPRPVRLGQRAVGWKASDVAEWLRTRSYVR